MDYLMLLGAVALLTADFALRRVFSRTIGCTARCSMAFTLCLGLCEAAIFFAASGFRLQVSGTSLGYALLSTACCTAYTMLGFRILSQGSMAIYTMFLMIGGMLVPYAMGVLFLGEELSALRCAGVIIICCSLALINRRDKAAAHTPLYLLLAVFLLNGGVSVASKLHQISPRAVPTLSFLVLGGLLKAALSGVALLFCGRDPAGQSRRTGRYLLIALLCAALGGGSYFLQLLGAKALPATVLYPVITGGSVVCTTLCGRLCFGERLDARAGLGVALCFAGTCLFL